MPVKNADILNFDLDKRLDNIFPGSNNYRLNRKYNTSKDIYSLIEFKTILLSLDWEISDYTLADFLTHIDNLKALYRNEKIEFKLIQIMESLGRYIKKNRTRTHPNAFKVLYSAFHTIEKIAFNNSGSSADKKQLFKVELEKFNEFKTLLSEMKKTGVVKGSYNNFSSPNQAIKNTNQTVQYKSNPNTDVLQISEQRFQEAIEDIKRFIKAEINSLRGELN